MTKTKIITVIIILTLIIIGILAFAGMRSSSRKTLETPSQQKSDQTTQDQQNEAPKIISTKPDPLDNITIPASQVIEITFNRSLQNAPEFKVRIEPKIDFKIELSSDRKTAKIITKNPFNLGAEYTLSIGPDTKFDGIGEWKQDKSFHFRTIKYTGV